MSASRSLDALFAEEDARVESLLARERRIVQLHQAAAVVRPGEHLNDLLRRLADEVVETRSAGYYRHLAEVHGDTPHGRHLLLIAGLLAEHDPVTEAAS